MTQTNVPIPEGATIAPNQPQTQTQPQTQPQAQAVPIPEDAVVQNEGEQINDVGNRVIVPKDGESFSDTMKRAADYGKTVTPKQIDAEMQTAPKKAAQVLVAAPLIGAGIPAAEAGLAELPGAGKVILDHLESKAAQYASQYPHLVGIAKAMGIPTTTAGVLLYAHHLFSKDK
jgi:hypothetical protein